MIKYLGKEKEKVVFLSYLSLDNSNNLNRTFIAR